jgi:hypothetical protein
LRGWPWSTSLAGQLEPRRIAAFHTTNEYSSFAQLFAEIKASDGDELVAKPVHNAAGTD